MPEERAEDPNALRIEPIALHQEMQRSYLEYAGSALPQMRPCGG